MSSLVDYQASYNLDPRSTRSIQAVSALPGQYRQGRHGAATSRFFSRRSLLGSSASGVAPAGLTRQSDVPPLSFPDTRHVAVTQRNGPPQVSRTASQQPYARFPATVHIPAPAPARVRQQPSSHTTLSRSESSRPGKPYLPIPLTSLPAQASQMHKIDKWRAGITLEPPPSHDGRTVSSVSTRDHQSLRQPSRVDGGNSASVHIQQTAFRPLPSSRPKSKTEDTATSFFPDIPEPVEQQQGASSGHYLPSNMSHGAPASTSRLSTIEESPRVPDDNQPSRGGSKAHPAIRIRPPSVPPSFAASSHHHLNPPPSAKPSIASLPRLSSSTQAPLGYALQGFLSDEDTNRSVLSQPMSTRDKGKQREIPAAGNRADLQARVDDVDSTSADSLQAELPQSVPLIHTKHRYGNPSDRMEDRLPFEPPRQAVGYRADLTSPHLVPASATQQGAPDIQSIARDIPLAHNAPRYAAESTDKKMARNLAEARQELATIISDKSYSNRHQAAYPRSPVRVRDYDEASNTQSDSGSDSEGTRRVRKAARRRKKEQHRAKRAALEKLDTTYPRRYDSMGISRVPVSEIESLEEDYEGQREKAGIRRASSYPKPATPFVRSMEATSGEETDVTVRPRATAEPLHNKTKAKREKKPKRSKKREPEPVHGILKKSQPSPYVGTHESASQATHETRKVSFGEATPADAGPIHEPPPHGNQADESTTTSTSTSSHISPSGDPYQGEPVSRSREPSPNLEELAESRRNRRSRQKDRKRETGFDVPDEPKAFDFSKMPGPPPSGKMDQGKQATVADDSDEKYEDQQGIPDLDFTKAGKGIASDKTSKPAMKPAEYTQPVKTPKRNPLNLPALPVIDNVYTKLPALYLFYGVEACKGTSVYRRLREMIWDYHADLEDVNKRRHKYWVPLGEACEGLIVKMRNSLEDQTCKKKMHIYMTILGTDDDPDESTIIFGRRAVSEQIRQVLKYTVEAIAELLDIVQQSDEIFHVAGQLDDVPETVRRGFLGANTGLRYMEEYFKHLFREIGSITQAIREIFTFLVHVPSPDELAEFPDEKIQFYKGAKDDLIEWMDAVLAATRRWKTKVSYANFERQLNSLRNLDRKWAEADDVQFGLLKNLFCFGFCLPRSTREALREQANAQGEEKTAVVTQQPSAIPKMQVGPAAQRPTKGHPTRAQEQTPTSYRVLPQEQPARRAHDPQMPAFLADNPALKMDALTDDQKLALVQEMLAAQKEHSR